MENFEEFRRLRVLPMRRISGKFRIFYDSMGHETSNMRKFRVLSLFFTKELLTSMELVPF